jgi:hypothetical protein
MRGGPAEVTVIDQEGGGQAQQRFGRQERHLPAAVGRTARGQRPELLPCLADRQVQVISQLSHAWRLQPARPHKEPLSQAATAVPLIGAPMIGRTVKASEDKVAVEVTWRPRSVGGRRVNLETGSETPWRRSINSRSPRDKIHRRQADHNRK